MIWGQGQMGSVDYVLGQNPNYVLGFNEPERTDQANIEHRASDHELDDDLQLDQVVQHCAMARTSSLYSPAVADTGGSTGGQQWLSSFMSQASSAGLKVDAVAFHWYDISTPTDPALRRSSRAG